MNVQIHKAIKVGIYAVTTLVIATLAFMGLSDRYNHQASGLGGVAHADVPPTYAEGGYYAEAGYGDDGDDDDGT